MKVISWNVNSIKARWELFEKFCVVENPSIILLQETKVQDHDFPSQKIQDLGYHSVFFGQKTFNGVAILIAKNLQYKFVGNRLFAEDALEQARFIEIEILYKDRPVSIVSIYIPNGESVLSEKFQYKLHFLDVLYKKIKNILHSERELIIGGDFNIAPNILDLWHPDKMHDSCSFTFIERQYIQKLLNLDLHDPWRYLNPHVKQFSWWDYRHGSFQKNLGMRIDYFLVTSFIMQNIKNCQILKNWRDQVKPSDHTPILLDI